MKRYFSLITLALLLSVALIAQQRPGPNPNRQGLNPDGPAPHGEKLVRCLSVLDLNAEQETQIRSIIETSKATIEALREDARADHQALRDAIDSGADECTVGAAFLEVHENREQMQAVQEQIREDIAAILTPEQQQKLAGCLQAPGRSRGPRD